MAHACYVCNFYPVPDGDGVECPHCHRLQYGTRCPNCGQNAPTIIRGMRVYCSACNQPRGPLTSGVPLNVVGQPSRVGSSLSRFVGWSTLLGSLMLAVLLGLLFGVIGGATVGLVAAMVVALVGGGLSYALLRGGRKLQERSDLAQRAVREQAIYALAARRGGVLTASEVATALNLQVGEADAALTALANEAGRVSVEVDANGTVQYVFQPAPPREPPTRVELAGGAEPTGVRVATDEAAAGTAGGTEPESEADRIKAQVDREFAQMQARSQANKR